uniref:Uncharacterized protein n=1 Tax=Rhizophora mucronata TaxID=61149 RepID=A0A2P2N1L8_RHIMU
MHVCLCTHCPMYKVAYLHAHAHAHVFDFIIASFGNMGIYFEGCVP